MCKYDLTHKAKSATFKAETSKVKARARLLWPGPRPNITAVSVIGNTIPLGYEVKTFWMLMRQDMMGWDGSGISRTICKQSAPYCRQITTPTPHQSIFTGQMFFLTPDQQCQSTEGTAD